MSDSLEARVSARLERLEEKIEAACVRSGRKREDVRLMAVTKFHPLETALAARKAGIRLFGESRVQEGREKFGRFRENFQSDENVEVHLIGSLQRNKAKAAAAFFDCIQSVDRNSLIDDLGHLTVGREFPLMIMLEYRTGEETKSGFNDEVSLFAAAERVLSFPGLCPGGLMTMAPFTGDKAAVRGAFRKLAAAGRGLETRFPFRDFAGRFYAGFPAAGTAGWSCLSMGMTNDYEIAIEEGSSIIRIGTALFGEREA